jgi:uncharacterized protein YraI
MRAAAIALTAAFAACAAPAAAATADSSLHLRAGPGVKFPVVTTAPAGAYLKVKGCAGGWCAVAYHGRELYARKSRISHKAQISKRREKTVRIVAYAPPPRVYYYGPSYYPTRPLGYYDPRGWRPVYRNVGSPRTWRH